MTQYAPFRTNIDAAPEKLTESKYHELLAADRRRTTLDVLTSLTAPIDLMDLADRVAARELDLGCVDEATVERVAISLHHTHLPKMADLGVIDYDPDSSRVES